MKQLSIALLNDSFYPCIDGVANAVMNYAKELSKYNAPVVFTPKYPGSKNNYPFPVVHYQSIDIVPWTGYRVGIPYARSIKKACHQYDFDIIHSHCPFVSAKLAMHMRKRYHVPTIFTYHTKYDIDIDDNVGSEKIRRQLKKMLLKNINAFDYVWAVSEGACESLSQLGYQKDITIMRNGADIPRQRAEEDQILALRKQWNIVPDMPVFLFVGRIMWYKGIRQILDGMRQAKAAGYVFKTIFIGDGADRAEVQRYVDEAGLSDEVVFTGIVFDRTLLAAYYSMALLLLFPSEYDTNGLVVREAAACSLPSVLLRGSSAAEGIVDNRNGFLISSSAEDISEKIIFACNFPRAIEMIGETTAREVYLSWETAVMTAYDAYGAIIQSSRRISKE